MASAPEVLAFTVDEAALLIKLSGRTVRKLIHMGELQHTRVGKVIRIPKASLDSFFKKRFHPTQTDEQREQRERQRRAKAKK